MVAIGPPNPLGYYKDEEKTARTFRTIDGVRYSIPGDWCIVEADGTLTLLGRGNACINTAGEKVFPEEVEEALKTHPSIEDALVVGLPDEKWGQAVTGVVELAEGASLDEAALGRTSASRWPATRPPSGSSSPTGRCAPPTARPTTRPPRRRPRPRWRAWRPNCSRFNSSGVVPETRAAESSGSPSASPAKQIPDSSLRSLPG